MAVVSLSKSSGDSQEWIVQDIRTSNKRLSSSLIKPAPGAPSTAPYGPAFSKVLLMDKSEWCSEDADPKITSALISYHEQLSDLRSATQLISEIIKALWEEAKTKVDGLNVLKSTSPRIHAVVTHPMTWNSGTIKRLKAAVELAGVDKEACSVNFLSESQAAARATFWDVRDLIKTQQVCSVLFMGSDQKDELHSTAWPPF